MEPDKQETDSLETVDSRQESPEITSPVKPQVDPDTEYFSVSLSKFAIMYIVTLGIYTIYWFYRHWKLQQPHMEQPIWPIPRAIFAIFFTHSLARRVENSMQNKKLDDSNNLNMMATLFVLLSIAGGILNASSSPESPAYMGLLILAAFLFSVYPLIEIQEKINLLKGDPLGKLNAKYSAANITAIIVGSFFWFLFILGLLLGPTA